MLLFHTLFLLAGLGVGLARGWTSHSLLPVFWAPGIALLISNALTMIAGRRRLGHASRPVVPVAPAAGPAAPDDLSSAHYIETTAGPGPRPYSCSFVEFDERGDYLDFEQHRQAYERIRTLARSGDDLLLVIFVHGWRHGAQTQNVIDFNHFLSQLSTVPSPTGRARRVHGLYLAWRGGCVRPDSRFDTSAAEQVRRHYSKDIIAKSESAWFPRLNFVVESFSYFDRKSIPEHKFSGTSISRTLFSAAHAAKRDQLGCEILLMGHSFGGLMLERTFQNATIGELAAAWPWEDPVRALDADPNPLPFDSVLFVNSAAPSIYAKQFQSYLAAHRQAMARNKVAGANSPVFISLTSAGDSATGKIHPAANSLCGLLPSLRRRYGGGEFILVRPAGDGAIVSQAYYYKHTPGHNPLLVNRFIERGGEAVALEEGVGASSPLHRNFTSDGRLDFLTSGQKGAAATHWELRFPPQEAANRRFSCYRGVRPVAWQQDAAGAYEFRESAYWIVRCPRDIIRSHDDIWSQQAMETYAALHRAAVALQHQPPALLSGPKEQERCH